MPNVSGTVVFSDEVSPGLAGDVVVQLHEILAEDAASRVVAEQVIPVHALPAGLGGRLPFQLEVGAINSRARYTIRAHVRVNKSDAVTSGDYLTTASFPVLTYGAASTIDVSVRRLT